jgi:(p)ppGpp synthase/HD superfamily hydrolase
MEEQMSAIERAIATALDAHEGQVDKGGAPYILHPLRVMAAVEQMCPDCPEEVLVAAVLHDVIEDSHFSHLDIQQMFGDKVKRYVTLLTKEIPDDLYYQLIKRNRYACYIKLADLRDNMDASRLSEITEKDVIRINNYKRREQEIIAAIASFH